jgi:hypothetical protein
LCTAAALTMRLIPPETGGAHAHQRDDIAIVAVHALAAAGVIAACLGLDIADIDDVAEQFALVRLRHRSAEMHAEPVINQTDIVERIALARQPAQQQKTAAVQ